MFIFSSSLDDIIHEHFLNLQVFFLVFCFSFCLLVSFSFFPIFIRYLAHLHFQCYTKSPPYPPTPTPLPTHSPFLALAFLCTGAYKVCKSNGPLFALMADQAIFSYICSQRQELRGTGQFILLFHIQGCRSLQLLGYFLQLLHWGPCDPYNS